MNLILVKKAIVCNFYFAFTQGFLLKHVFFIISFIVVVVNGLSVKRKVKLKSDHRSEFSNLSNWKEEA